MSFLREPLLQFLLLGGALFLLFGVVNDGGEAAPDEIVVTSGTIQHLGMTFARTWQRPPSAAELDGLIEDHVREEVFYREAVALGFDRDDIIIRRRLRQKMEFVADDIAAQVEPSDDDLNTYLESHATAFRLPARFTFRQVYLDSGRRGANLPADAARLRALLNGGNEEIDLAALGDPLMLATEFRDVSRNEVAATFGEQFALQLQSLGLGSWQGPVLSGYGAHLVLLEQRDLGRQPRLEEVRDAVRRDWEHERRKRAGEELYQTLLRRHTVRVERAEGAKRDLAQGAE